MIGDPFASARRALLVGPAIALVGAVVVYLGIVGDGLAWLLCVAGGVLVLLGALRTLAAGAILLVERNRVRLLNEGTHATGTVKSAERLGDKLGHPIFRCTIGVELPDGRVVDVERKGAVEPQYAGELVPGAELPLRVDPNNPSSLAVDWESL